MLSVSVGTLIWISVRPLVKLIIPTLGGFILARNGSLPPSATKSIALLTLNLTLPALLISKISVAINSENVGSLGPICLVSITYMVVGSALAFVIRSLTPTPANFRNGVIFSLVWTILQTMVVWFITLFPMQGYRLVKRDYDESARNGVSPRALTERLRTVGTSSILRRRPFKRRTETTDTPMHLLSTGAQTPDLTLPPKLLHHDSSAVSPASPDLPYTPAQEPAEMPETELSIAQVPAEPPTSFKHRLLSFLKSFFSPCVIAVIVGLLIALVRPLHALFIETPGAGIPNAPDGSPPLAILMETVAFLGNANVPLGLIILGSSMARMVVPRPISKLPIWSISAVAIAKLFIMPIVGIGLTQALTARGIVDQNAKVLRFCLAFFSFVPSATFQVALSQVYAPVDGDSNASVLCSYLLAQYALLPISLTIATAVSLSLTF